MFGRSSAILATKWRNLAPRLLSTEAFSKLREICGTINVSKAPSTLEQHSHDESYHRLKTPDAVVWPKSTQEVSDIAKYCTSKKIVMIPFGTGTGLEGGVAPSSRGICVNLTKMDQISDLHVEDFDVTVQPGVTRKALDHYLKGSGLWFPVDPGADASLCGMVATGASGTNAVRYGTMKENVINLEVVLSDGRIVHTAGEHRRFKKSSAGYNLTNLFVGSEGTLGFITSATLRLHPVPESILSAVCAFPSVKDAVTFAVNMIQAGIPIARVEYLCEKSMASVNKFSKLSYPVMPSVFLEFHGSESSTKEQVQLAGELAVANNGSDFAWAESQEEKNKLWKARHDFLYAALSQHPGTVPYSTDVCVPISRLPEAVTYASTLVSETGCPGCIAGHVGDGNFHCLLCIHPSEEQMKIVVEFSNKVARYGLGLGGTCTGEHGIGFGKKKLLVEEVGAVGIDVMKSIKSALDPLGLMNPGKIL